MKLKARDAVVAIDGHIKVHLTRRDVPHLAP